LVVVVMISAVKLTRTWSMIESTKNHVRRNAKCGPNTKADPTSDYDNNMIVFSA
jgi:hypothetical protein